MPTSALIASHFLCQPIRPAWSHSAFLAPSGLLLGKSWATELQDRDLLSQAEVISGPASDTLTFLWKMFERSHESRQRAKVILQIGRTPGSIPLLEKISGLSLNEEETLALIEALARHGDPRQLPLLQSLYRRFWSQPRYQQEILLAAGHTQSEQSLAFLKEIYASAWHRPEYRQTVIRALGLHGRAEAIAMLVGISRQYESDLKLQRAVIRSLGYSSCAASAHVLKEMLSRYPQSDMRQLTWRALAATASDTAVEVLRASLRRATDPRERKEIQQALQRAHRIDED